MKINVMRTAVVRSGWAALAITTLFATACSGSSTAPGVTATLSSGGTTTSTPEGTTTSTPEETTNPASQSTAPPPGLPADWQNLAISAANAVLQTCAQATSLSPNGCPQNDGAGLEALAAHWTVLTGLLVNPVAVPVGSGDPGALGQVSVFGRFQMVVSYTMSGQGIRPYLGYAGGIADATMSWDGTSFQNVQLRGGRFVPQLPAGVTVAPFTRPGAATDAAAMAAVQAGFNDCATLPVPPPRPNIPNCPMHAGTDDFATSGQWTINGDPLQGALVSFDTEHGYIAVTGSYSMNFNFVTPPEGIDSQTSWTKNDFGQYTAILAWDGQKLQLLDIGLE